jgi:hypothetical protein
MLLILTVPGGLTALDTLVAGEEKESQEQDFVPDSQGSIDYVPDSQPADNDDDRFPRALSHKPLAAEVKPLNPKLCEKLL